MKICITSILITLILVGCTSSTPSAKRVINVQPKQTTIQKKRVVVKTEQTTNLKDPHAAKLYYKMATKHWHENNYTEALIWFKKASHAGNLDANIDVGRIYREGLGRVDVNYPEAVKYYSKGVKQGDSGAQLHLAKMYLDGKGVKRNYKEALRLLRRSSVGRDHKSYIADINIAYIHAKGLGVKRNLKLAELWLLESYKKVNSEQAEVNLQILEKMKQSSCDISTSTNIQHCNFLASRMDIRA